MSVQQLQDMDLANRWRDLRLNVAEAETSKRNVRPGSILKHRFILQDRAKTLYNDIRQHGSPGSL